MHRICDKKNLLFKVLDIWADGVTATHGGRERAVYARSPFGDRVGYLSVARRDPGSTPGSSF